MQYDVTNPRYAHLAGLTDDEIELVMALADLISSWFMKPEQQTQKGI